MALSDRQLTAAHRLGQDVCVVAGPGSGKTSVLIERFSWLVRERGIAPGRILAITFTEKAATEIKDRMVRAFDDAPAVREQIERAYVSTIHSFCARLLREHAIEAGVDPSFNVLDQPLPLLRGTADDVLEELYRADPAGMRRFLRSLAVATDRGGFVADLATSLIEMYDAVRLAGGSWDVLRYNPAPVDELLERLRQIASEILADCPAARSAAQKDQHGTVNDWCRRVLDLPHEIVEEHFRVLARQNAHKTYLAAGSAARKHEDALRRLTQDLARAALPHYYAAERALIIKALTRIDEEYRRRKRAASSLDFDDLEEFAIRLLSDNAELRTRVQQSFDFILMDELQDTNPLQWKLMELVRRSENFFAVGDVNQSIYGFRHARPELFGAYRLQLESAGLAVDELRDNYRSRPEVLDAVNRVFGSAAGVEPHSLTAGKSFAPASAPSVEVQVTFGETGADTERTEALWVARRIAGLVGSAEVVDRDGTVRVARYGDVAVLARANYSTAALQSALDEFGVPSVVLGGLTFYETREVRDLRLLLDVLVNPRNELALAGLLRSPLFGVTDEWLMRAALQGPLLRSVEADPPAGWSTVTELRAIRNQVSPDRLLRRIIDERDYESGLTGRARANIDKFLAMLRERYSRAPVPLAEVVAGLDDAAPEAEAPPAQFSNAVRLMTLHKAKGLEFPVVCLPYLHKGRSYGFPVISYSTVRGLGVKWRNPATNMGEGDTFWHANRKDALDAQDAEENRLLYVGMTRARDRLLLSWSSTGNERGAWPGLLTGGLGLDLSVGEQVTGGVRVFTTAAPPEPAPGAAAFSAAGTDVFVRRAPAADAADSSASVTDISRFSECPRKYYLSRYLRWEASARKLVAIDEQDAFDPPQDLTASELGRQVHAILAGQNAGEISADAAELADRFLTSPLGKRAARAQAKAHEWDFLFDAGGTVLRGQVDLWFEHNREVIIVDYKTDRDPDPHTIAGHSLQVQLYALALERWMGRRPDRGVLFFVRNGREVEVDVSPLALGAAQDAVYRFRSAQAHGQYPLRAGEQCRRCDFHRGLCPEGR